MCPLVCVFASYCVLAMYTCIPSEPPYPILMLLEINRTDVHEYRQNSVVVLVVFALEDSGHLSLLTMTQIRNYFSLKWSEQIEPHLHQTIPYMAKSSAVSFNL